MSKLDQEDIDNICVTLEQRLGAKIVAEVTSIEDHHPVEGPKVHTRAVKRRLIVVVIVMGSLMGVDHIVHLDGLFRCLELMLAAFFDWFFNVSKDGKTEEALSAEAAAIKAKRNAKKAAKAAK
jgi:hypothetical protein